MSREKSSHIKSGPGLLAIRSISMNAWDEDTKVKRSRMKGRWGKEE